MYCFGTELAGSAMFRSWLDRGEHLRAEHVIERAVR